jgi:hypothetical protein
MRGEAQRDSAFGFQLGEWVEQWIILKAVGRVFW